MPNITTNRAITYTNNIVVQTLSLMQSQMDQMSVDLLNMVNAQFLDLRNSDRHWHECCQKTTLQYHKICLVFSINWLWIHRLYVIPWEYISLFFSNKANMKGEDGNNK